MPRPEKVAAVEEIREKLTTSHAAVLTEYRGLSVPDLAELRATLRASGTTYKVYKNTLARRAVDGAEIDGGLRELLVGPTAFAFIDQGDVVAAAKALDEFSKSHQALVIKGALLDGRFISAEQVEELAGLPSREELLAKLAGAFQAPVRRAAGLFSALQRNTAYAVKALIDKRVEAGEAPPPEDASAEDAAAAPESPAAEDSEDSTAEPAAEDSEDEAEATDSTAEPAAEDSEDDSRDSSPGESPGEESTPEDEEASAGGDASSEETDDET